MTVAVAFLCPDGVVVAADSMITPFLGNIAVGHHTGRKVYSLPGEQVFSWAGDLGLAMRVKALVEANPASGGNYGSALDYALQVSQAINTQCSQTQVQDRGSTACFVGFPHKGQGHCCVLTGGLQPHLFDNDHFYMALGTGKLSADPFLKFLVDIFCKNSRPNVHQAAFFAAWTVQHAIDTTQGQVAEPIRVAIIEPVAGGLQARELSEPEIELHLQSKQSAEQALRDWRAGIQSGAAAHGTEPVPVPIPPEEIGETAPASSPAAS